MINKTEAEIMKNWQGDIDHPVVSIRCATYNHERFISQCLDGFLMQETTFPFEVIVHDDASTDRTTEIIRKYEIKYPDIIRPIYEKENQYSKHDGSLRKIIDSKVRGEYTASCEGDDYWTSPEKLQRQISFLQAHPDYSMVFHAADYIDGNMIVFNDQRSPEECDFSADEIIHGGGDFCATASLCMRTALRMERYDFQNHADVGDYPMQIAMALKGKVHYYPETMSVYRLTTGNKASWVARTLTNREKRIKHNETEIAWLQELNNMTDGAHRNAINYRIALMSVNLLQDSALSMEEIKHIVNSLSNEDREEIRRKILLIRKQRIKNWIKAKVPHLSKTYKIIMKKTKGKKTNNHHE